MKMTSRSSPWMFSRFLTKNGSGASTVEEQLDAGVLPPPQFKLVLDRELLAEVEGPHA